MLRNDLRSLAFFSLNFNLLPKDFYQFESYKIENIENNKIHISRASLSQLILVLKFDTKKWGYQGFNTKGKKCQWPLSETSLPEYAL